MLAVMAPRVALVADARGALAGAVGGERVKPIDDRVVAPALVDQPAQCIAAGSGALRALDHEHIELADQIAERGADTWHALPDEFKVRCITTDIDSGEVPDVFVESSYLACKLIGRAYTKDRELVKPDWKTRATCHVEIVVAIRSQNCFGLNNRDERRQSEFCACGAPSPDRLYPVKHVPE